MSEVNAVNIVDMYNEFAVDATKAVEGVLVHYKGDVSFLIARTGNKVYQKTVRHLYQKNQRVLDQKDDAAADKLTEIVIEAMAKAILVGWEGTVVFQGEALVYNLNNAKKLLALEVFRDWVDSQSKDESKYKAFQEQEEEGN